MNIEDFLSSYVQRCNWVRQVWSKMHYDCMNEAVTFLKSKGVTMSQFPKADRDNWKGLPRPEIECMNSIS